MQGRILFCSRFVSRLSGMSVSRSRHSDQVWKEAALAHSARQAGTALNFTNSAADVLNPVRPARNARNTVSSCKASVSSERRAGFMAYTADSCFLNNPTTLWHASLRLGGEMRNVRKRFTASRRIQMKPDGLRSGS